MRHACKSMVLSFLFLRANSALQLSALALFLFKDVYDKSCQAVLYTRTNSAPSLVLYQELIRRFGHAATDRQHAYLDASVVDKMAESDVVASGIVQAVEQLNALTYNESWSRFEEIGAMVKKSFDLAVEEPKITSRDDMLKRISQPTVFVPPLSSEVLVSRGDLQSQLTSEENVKYAKREVMRKHMTRVISEVMEDNSKIVYLGEGESIDFSRV